MAIPTSPHDPLLGAVVDERWKIVERLGAGAMGVVYRAERLKLGKQVAIKFIDERCARTKEGLARFDREARAISRVQHTHCVTILDFGVHKQRPYIAMEYVRGRRLGLEMGKPALTVPRAIKIMRQMLEGLRHAHAHGVVHRDLKPDNVMLAEVTGTDDFVKILDFGLARIISVDEPSISLPAMVAGTPSYMSPEQARGEKADHRSDLYSAGVILYAMCVGKKPFSSEDDMEVLRMHLRAEPPAPRKVAKARNLSPQLERVILRALDKDRETRFCTAQEFLDALSATPEGRAASGRASSRKLMRAITVVVALGLVAAGAAGALLFRSHGRGLGELVARTPPAPTVEAPAVIPPAVKPDPAPPVAVRPELVTPPVAVKPELVTPPVAAAPPVAVKPEPVTPPVAVKPELVTPPVAPAPPVAVEPVAPPRVVESPPPVTPTPPIAARPRPVAPAPEATAEPSPSASVPPEIAGLISAHKYREAQRRLLDEQLAHPRAVWVHLELGEIYFRQLWRKDAVREWDEALRLDPSLTKDPRLAAELCAALQPKWERAAERLIETHFKTDAVAAMTECLRHARDPAQRDAATRILERAKSK